MAKMFDFLGKGTTSDVYYLNEDLILKLYHDNITEEEALKEFKLSAYLHSKIEASPAAADLVEIGGRHGLLLENLGSVTLLDAMKQEPDRAYEYGIQYGELAKNIHKNKADPDLPAASETLKRGLLRSEGELKEEVRAYIRKKLDDFPKEDTLLHGDLSPKNIMVKNGRLYVIDPMTLRNGPAIYDLLPCFMFCHIWGEFRAAYLALSPEDKAKDPAWARFLSNYAEFYVDETTTRRVWKGFLKGCYGDLSEEESRGITAEIRELNYIKYAAAIWNLDLFPYEVKKKVSSWAEKNIIKLINEQKGAE